MKTQQAMKELGIPFNDQMMRAWLNTKVGSWPPEPINPDLPYKGQTRRSMRMPDVNEVPPDTIDFREAINCPCKKRD